LNTPPIPDHEEEMRLALRRSVFELKTPRNTKKPSVLEKILL
jgi:hypothetical protein